jgi:YVTN family beta-propeller protein
VSATIPLGIGAEPQGIAVDPVTHEIFVVSNAGSTSTCTAAPYPWCGTLSVIDQRTDTVTHTIALGPGHWIPLGLDPYSGKVYVASESTAPGTPNGIIDVISVRTDEVIDSMTTPIDPYAIAVDPYTHTVYFANYCDLLDSSCTNGSVSVMSERTNAIIATIPVGPVPEDAVFDPVRHEVFVSNYGASGGGTVTVIDTRTNTVAATVPVGDNPWGESVDPATGRVYVANVFGNSVSVIDERTNTVTDTIPTPDSDHPIYVVADPANGQIYVSILGSSDVDVIDERTNTVTSTITAVPEVYQGVVAGSQLYMESRGSSTSNVANLSVLQVAPGFSWWGPW